MRVRGAYVLAQLRIGAAYMLILVGSFEIFRELFIAINKCEKRGGKRRRRERKKWINKESPHLRTINTRGTRVRYANSFFPVTILMWYKQNVTPKLLRTTSKFEHCKSFWPVKIRLIFLFLSYCNFPTFSKFSACVFVCVWVFFSFHSAAVGVAVDGCRWWLVYLHSVLQLFWMFIHLVVLTILTFSRCAFRLCQPNQRTNRR